MTFQRLQRFFPVVVLFGAILVRVEYFREISGAPWFSIPVVQDRDYWFRAIGILNGGWPGNLVYPQSPGYPYLLAGIIALLGENVAVVRFVHLMLGAVNCLLVYHLAIRLFERPGLALLAGLLAAFNGTLLFFDGELLPVAIPITCNLAALYLLLSRSRIAWLVGAILWAVSITQRSEVLLLAPFMIHRLLVESTAPGEPGGSRGARVGFAGLVGAAAFAVILPFTLHNIAAERYDQCCFQIEQPAPADVPPLTPSFVVQSIVNGSATMLSCNGGENLYLGNNPEVYDKNSFDLPYFWDLFRFVNDLPCHRGIRKPAAQSAFLKQETISAITANPANVRAFVAILADKVVGSLDGTEIQRNMDPYPFRRYSAILAVLLWKNVLAFPSGLLLPFGLAGFGLSWLRGRGNLLIAGYFLVYGVVQVVFFPASRYRAPLVPVLGIFAIYLFFPVGAGRLHRRSRAVLAIFTAVTLPAANFRVGPMATEQPSYVYGNLGNVLIGQGNLQQGELFFRKAVRMNPLGSPERLNLANCLADQGRCREAISYFQTGRALVEETGGGLDVATLARLAACQFRENDREGLWETFERQLRRNIAVGPTLDLLIHYATIMGDDGLNRALTLVETAGRETTDPRAMEMAANELRRRLSGAP